MNSKPGGRTTGPLSNPPGPPPPIRTETSSLPTPAFSSSGEPETTILPAFIIAILWQSLSASSMSWVVRKIVVRSSSFSFLTCLHTSNLAAGSSPMLGSSKNRTLGLLTRACAISSLRIIPPEKVLTRSSDLSPSPMYRRASLIRVPRSARST